MPVNRISIDAGQKGYLAYWSKDWELIKTVPMPLMKRRKFVDGYEVSYLINEAQYIYLEEQYSLKGQKGMKTNIMNYGVIYHAILQLGMNPIEIHPARWVPAMGLSNTGRNPLLPKLTKKDRIKKVKTLLNWDCKTHDEADAILIGLYAKMNML